MSVSILVPFRSDDGDRDRIWAWARERWERTMPDCELIVCDDACDLPGEPFNEGRAWNNCAAQASGDILVLAESEVINSSLALRAAIESVQREGGWRIAETYYQLNELHTQRLLRMPPNIPLEYPLPRSATERIFFRESVASNIVVPREAFDLVGGYDERYDGWGWIDKAMAAALDTLYAPHRRFAGANYHLWHPRVEPARDCNPELTRRYLDVSGDKLAMTRLVRERVAV